MKKFIAVTLYVVYAVFITLLLIFGGSVSRSAVQTVQSLLYVRDLNDVEINIDTDETRLFGRTYYPVYTPIGDFYKAGLTFTSLDPDILKVSSKGAFSAYKTYEADEATARIRIGSRYDADFEKIITLHFEKQYPESFSVTYAPVSYNTNVSSIPVGLPVYVYPKVSTDVTVSAAQYEIFYDERYFTRREDGVLLPIATTPEGESTSFTIRYKNGVEATSKSFRVVDSGALATEIDEIRLGGNPIDEGMTVNSGKRITLYYQGERVYSDFTVSFGEEDKGKINARSSAISFSSAGEKTVTVTLANGFQATFPITVKSVIALPILEDETLAETHLISVLQTEQAVYKYSFPKGTTNKTVKAEYDADMISVKTTSTSFTVIPKQAGETTFTLYVTDGNETLYMEDFTVEIEKDFSLTKQIMNNIPTIVTKYMGHFTLFVILAFFALNMFRYIETANGFVRVVRYLMCALPIAVVTEIGQIFIPRRTGSVKDVLIDMSGYLLGTLIGIILSKLLFRSRSEG